jgi:hypothetical protein
VGSGRIARPEGNGKKGASLFGPFRLRKIRPGI